MSWVGPEFVCGECGGTIARWPMRNLLRQDILDWRHKTVGAGHGEHRAVLGTPVPLTVLTHQEPQDDVEDGPDPVPAPLVPARPAMRDELPGPALRLDKVAGEKGWEVEAVYMHGPRMDARWKFVRMVESVVLRLRRDGHGLVAVWSTKRGEERAWEFDLAYSVGHILEPLSSPELNAAVKRPRMICESCQEPPALHLSTQTGPVCFTERSIEDVGGVP